MSRVPVAVIGLGFMGGRWARAIAEHHGARLAVVCDLRPELAEVYADRYGAEPLTDAIEAATRRGVEAVVVATPEHLHAGPVLAAIGAGKAVAVEKPLAHTVAACEEIRHAALSAGVPLLVGHILRFEPRYNAMYQAVEAGEIGEIQAVRSQRIGLVSDQEVLGGRTTVALYYGVHEFDLVRWYAGEVTHLWAARSKGVVAAHGHDVDDLYSVGFRLAGGGHGTAMVGWSLPARTAGFGMSGFTVIGSEGVLSVSQGDTGFAKSLAKGPADQDVYYSPEVEGIMVGAMGIEADHFVRCARGQADPLCTAADGTEAVRIALAMERAAETEEVVAL